MKISDRVSVLCVLACVLLVAHRYFAMPEFFDAHLARRFLILSPNELYRYLYSFGATFILLGLLPAILACALWDERPSEWGVGLGPNRAVMAGMTVLLFVAMLPILAYAGKNPAIAAAHPLSSLAARYMHAFVVYEFFLLLYMVGWEFFFRGFLLFGLKKKIGDAAVYLQVMPYAVMHLEKSGVEAWASIPAGIVLGHLAARSGSIWYGVILHWLCAITLDLIVKYRPL